MDLMAMENLLFGRNITRLYDLKGSARSRYNADSSGSNKVLLDQNLLEAMPTSPISVGNKAKRLLERAVWNDTSFLAVSFLSLFKTSQIPGNNFSSFYCSCQKFTGYELLGWDGACAVNLCNGLFITSWS
jgi:hypothetical protein